MNLLTGRKVLEEVESSINGKLTVVKDIVWGTYIQADGLTQTGGIVEQIWKNVFRNLLNTKHDIYHVLVLGLGGGTIAKLAILVWPYTKITGVDVDVKIVNLGKKYFALDCDWSLVYYGFVFGL